MALPLSETVAVYFSCGLCLVVSSSLSLFESCSPVLHFSPFSATAPHGKSLALGISRAGALTPSRTTLRHAQTNLFPFLSTSHALVLPPPPSTSPEHLGNHCMYPTILPDPNRPKQFLSCYRHFTTNKHSIAVAKGEAADLTHPDSLNLLDTQFLTSKHIQVLDWHCASPAASLCPNANAAYQSQ